MLRTGGVEYSKTQELSKSGHINISMLTFGLTCLAIHGLFGFISPGKAKTHISIKESRSFEASGASSNAVGPSTTMRGDRIRQQNIADSKGKGYKILFNTDRFGMPSPLGPHYIEYTLISTRALESLETPEPSGLAVYFPKTEYLLSSNTSSIDTINIPLPDKKPKVVAAYKDKRKEMYGALSAADIPLPLSRPLSATISSSNKRNRQEFDSATVTELLPLPTARPKRVLPRKEELALASPAAYAPVQSSLREGQAGGAIRRLFGPNGDRSQLLDPSSGVAIYDIKSATVHLPNGERLEAHSGLGRMRDNPGFVHVKNRGSTPPNVYNLVMRESRFHGTEAIRLLPADGRNKYNRDGLLAHPYLYKGVGGRAQSNGCVVFSNYERFLTAFKKGNVRKLIVVPNLDELPDYIAAL